MKVAAVVTGNYNLESVEECAAKRAECVLDTAGRWSPTIYKQGFKSVTQARKVTQLVRISGETEGDHATVEGHFVHR